MFPYFLGLFIGLITGLFYFGGLWFTVKKLCYSRKPKRFMAVSMAARMLPTLAVMFILIRIDPGMLAAMFLSFFGLRFIMIKRII